ncbi:MAG: TonB-dependent receptor [Cellvibrionaceae bacterium]|nr:TonB-dependent receptor [Cellvibrionaceae bacterium]
MCSLVLSGLAVPAKAEVLSTAQDEIEEVVVTAEAKLIGFGESHANNTVDLTAIQSENPGLDVMNLINRLPGVNVTQGDAIGGNDYATRIYIRGMSNSRSTAQIGYMIDDMPNGDSFYGGGQKPNRFIDSENLAQINVGQNASDISSASNTALGGTVRYYTAKPDQEFGLKTAITGGTDDLSRVYARLDSGEFAPGWSSFASYSRSEISSWPGTHSGQFDREHFDLKVHGEFDSGLTLSLKISDNFRDEDDYDSVSLAEFRSNPNSDGLVDEFSFDTVADLRRGWGGTRWDDAYSLEITQEFDSGARVTATPYFHHQKGYGWWTPPYRIATVSGKIESTEGGPREYFEGTYQRNPDGSLVAAAGTDVTGFDCLSGVHGDTVDYALNPNFSCAGAQRIATRRRSSYGLDRMGLTTEVELPLGEQHTLSIGGWFEYQDRDNGREWFDLDPNDPGNVSVPFSSVHWIAYDRNYETKTVRIYAQDEMEFGKLDITAGLVYHKVETTLTERIEGIERSQSNNEWLPKLGMVYRLNDTSEIFGSYSRNVRHLRDSVLTDGSTAQLNPEVADNFDLGYRWLGERISFVAQAFVSQFNDRLGEVDPVVAGLDQFLQNSVNLLNVGGVDTMGLELASNFTVNDELSMYGSFSVLDSEYTEDTPEEGIVAGNQLINVPTFQGFVEASWVPQALDNKFSFSANVKYVGEREGNLANSETIDSYSIFGLSASYELGDLVGLEQVKLQFNAQNLTDEDYLAAPDGDSGGRYYIGAPRSLSVTLRAQL